MIPVALATLSACGPSTTGPGEISGFGLVYDQRPGHSFEGLPRTTDAQMPTTIGTMTGPSRLISNDGTIVFADATLTVDVTTRDVTLTGEYEFPDTHPLGIIQIQQDGQLDVYPSPAPQRLAPVGICRVIFMAPTAQSPMSSVVKTDQTTKTYRVLISCRATD
jgi:hypothetical protein